MVLGDVTGGVTRLAQRLHDLHLQRLVDGPTGQRFEFAAVVGLDEFLDAVVGAVDGVVDLLFGLPRDGLVVDADGEPEVHDRPHRQRRDLVDENPGAGPRVVLGDGVDDFAPEGPDGVLVDGAASHLAVLDDDSVASRGRELQVQVVRQQFGEQGAAGPVLLAVLVDAVRFRQFVDTRRPEQVKRLRLVELRIGVGQQVGPLMWS